MRPLRTLFFCAAAAAAATCLSRPAAAAPEWNQVRQHVVEVGPEAHRLVVGFRATPGNVVVKTIRRTSRGQVFRLAVAQTSEADVASLAGRARIPMSGSRRIAPNMHVMFLQKTLYGADVEAALKALRADPAVQFAEVDQRRYPHAIPNDPLFVPSSGSSGQWFMLAPSSVTVTLGGTATQDLSATDAVDAWTVTRGSSGTVIADIDTGVRFDHPDLLRAGFGGRLLPGYDFVGQDYDRTTGAALGTYLIANDGDGWDPDPSDPGDWIDSTDQKNALFPSADCPVGDSSWHGTRVSGVLGALSNNGVGVAGMTWSGFLLPVRALGKCGGYDSDIIAGIQWAVGMTVEGVPDNPYPADIVNLSLGGSGSCPSDYQTVFDSLNAMGVLVVASAGNETGPVDAPANCSGVMAVGGLRNAGTKVGYSSFGPEVGISAPAGNCVDTSGDCYRSIDTTTNLGLTSPGTNSYTNETKTNLGTSFSAPIVAGVAALMRAVNANLTPAQLIARLKSSATAFPPNDGSVPVCSSSVTANGPSEGQCSCTTSECGAGMVNASGAVQAALAPIAAIVVPTSVPAGGSAVFDGSGSAAACGRTIASYAWTASGGVMIMGGASSAQATVMPSGTAGTLTLTVTDSTGQTDVATVNFTSSGAATKAPSSAGTAATACPVSLTVTPAAPTVAESFSPASVTENTASTLTITFNNSNAFALTQAGFTETVPANLTIESSSAPTTTCAGSGTLSNTTSSVTMTGAYIPANGSCSITLTVDSAAAAAYTNTIAAHALSTGPAGSNASSVSATLTVTAPAKSGGGGLDWPDLAALGSALLLTRRRPRRRGA